MEATNTTTQTTPTTTAPTSSRPARTGGGYRGNNPRSGGQGGRGGSGRPPFKREVVKPEFDSKTIQVRRVTRVTSGGRRFAFSVAVVIGDKKGSVGVGLGKAQDTASAIAKATVSAKKTMLRLNLTETKSLPHQNSVKVSSSRIELRPNFGKGLVAGSSARTVLELAGITDVTAKVLSPSRNKLNNARATLKALAKFAK